MILIDKNNTRIYYRLLIGMLSAGILLPLGLLFNYLLNILIARYLSVVEYGVFGTILSIATIAATLACMGFSSSMMMLIPECKINKSFPIDQGLIKGSFNVVVIAQQQ